MSCPELPGRNPAVVLGRLMLPRRPPQLHGTSHTGLQEQHELPIMTELVGSGRKVLSPLHH